MRSIASSHKLKQGFEPYSADRVVNYDGRVNKEIISEKSIEFWKEECKKYDKIVLLGRKNIKEAAESFAALIKKEFKLDQKWSPLDIKDTDISSIVENYQHCKVNLEKLSKLIDVPIDWYEDVYSSKTLKDKSIPLDELFLRPELKSRLEINERTLL